MKVLKFLLFISSFSLFSCSSVVNPNEWVVSTVDCWNHKTVTKAGDVIPRLTTSCDKMVILPATFLAADFNIDTKFNNRVAGNINLTYQWKINDPITFIENAKSITSCPTDDGHKIDVNALETIENTVVDKMIIDVIREYTPNKQAGLDELIIEKEVFELCKSKFSSRGIEFSSMSVNVKFSPQIEEALDAMSALEFYKASGETELGRDIIKAKAGVNNINIPISTTK